MLNKINTIEKLRLFILTNTLHNGIDWMHSLFDSHKDILIMPAISFYRTLDKFNINLEQLNNKKIVNDLTNIFYNQPGYKIPRRRFIKNKIQKKKFKLNFLKYLNLNKETNIYKKTFYGIHFSFAELYNIDLKKKKILISQEHFSWHSDKYLKIFKPEKFLFVIRDYRAAMTGSLKGFKLINSEEIYSHQFDKILANYLNGSNFIKSLSKNMRNKKIIFLMNENFNKDLKNNMKKLCKKLKITYQKSLLKQTFLGVNWFGESSYLTDGKIGTDLNKKVPKGYYNIKNVNKRYLTFLGNERLKIFEVFFKEQLELFEYKLFNNYNFFQQVYLKLKINFIFLNQGFYAYPKTIILFRNIIRRFMVLYFPKISLKIYNFY